MSRITYIAVVDDHIPFRKGLIVLINLFKDYQVLFEADNGRDMIEKIRAGRLPDIVLLDILMPVMDGFETACWLQTNYPEMKILALSTLDTEGTIFRMMEYGVKGYLLKGADGEELKAAVEKIVRGELYFTQEILKRGKRG